MDVVLTDYSCNNLLIKWHYLDSQIRSWSKSFCFPLATFQRSTYGASSQLLAGLWINLLHSQHVTRCCTLGCSQCVPSRVPSSKLGGPLPLHTGRVPCPSRRRGSVLGTELGTDGCAGFTIYALWSKWVRTSDKSLPKMFQCANDFIKCILVVFI